MRQNKVAGGFGAAPSFFPAEIDPSLGFRTQSALEAEVKKRRSDDQK